MTGAELRDDFVTSGTKNVISLIFLSAAVIQRFTA